MSAVHPDRSTRSTPGLFLRVDGRASKDELKMLSTIVGHSGNIASAGLIGRADMLEFHQAGLQLRVGKLEEKLDMRYP